MKLLFLLALVFLAGCQSDSNELEKQIIEFAKNDQTIDHQEYQKLVDLVDSYDNSISKAFKDKTGHVDDEKFVSYLKKILQSLKMSSVEIIRDDAASNQTAPFNVNVFLDNSVSMDGYLKRGGDGSFQATVSSLLTDIRISDVCDSLNFSYANNASLHKQRTILKSDIHQLFEKLNPVTFKREGGDRSASDIERILNKALQTVDDRNSAIIISDFVFSPGSKADAQEYLHEQSEGIKMGFAAKRDSFDLAVIIIQLASDFDGKYYDKTNKPIRLTSQRPYYIWIIGSKAQIKEIVKRKLTDNTKGSQHKLLLYVTNKEQRPSFKIIRKPQIGSFEAKSLQEGIITKASASREGKFGFDVAVNFSNELLNNDYVQDTTNYILSNKHYHLTVETIQDKNNPALKGFTHLLHFTTDQLRDEVLEVDLIGKGPSWVNAISSQDDSNILHDDAEKGRTFGFRHLVEGVCDAFYPAASSNTLSKFSIQIKK